MAAWPIKGLFVGFVRRARKADGGWEGPGEREGRKEVVGLGHLDSGRSCAAR